VVVTAVVVPSAHGVVTVVLPSALVSVVDVDVVVLPSALVVIVVTVEDPSVLVFVVTAVVEPSQEKVEHVDPAAERSIL